MLQYNFNKLNKCILWIICYVINGDMSSEYSYDKVMIIYDKVMIIVISS